MLLNKRTLFCWIALSLVVVGNAEVRAWEKRLAPGLTYRMEVDSSVPRITHALRYSFGATNVKASSELAQGVVYAEDDTKGRETVSALGKRLGALAAVNADFFPFTGHPLGIMVRGGELVTLPYPTRSFIAWNDSEAKIADAEFKGELTTEGATLAIDGLNESARPNGITLFTDKAGVILGESPNFAITLRAEGALKPNGEIHGEVEQTLKNVDKRKTEAGFMTLVATGEKIAALRALRTGDKVTLACHTTGPDWTKFGNAVGGGPRLLTDGKPTIDWEHEGFKDTFANQRNPRTAIGITADHDLWVVVVEGRQPDSDGATLEELAKIMQRYGCADAMNLDGGGSSQLALSGMGLVRPTDKTGERPVADCIAFTAPSVRPDSNKLEFRGVPSIAKGATAVYNVYSGSDLVPNREVFWSVRGPAWVDQGGTVHAESGGKIILMAATRGHLLRTELTISGASAKETPAKGKGKTKAKPKKAATPAVKKKVITAKPKPSERTTDEGN